jgi:uncharacterized phage-associated protein
MANINKDKLINAIIYFNKHTTMCHETKLFKLLFYLDFDHFQETGRSITGLDYYAWKMGPVPKELRNALLNPPDELSEKFDISIAEKSGYKTFLIEPKVDFNPSVFTRRELRILKDVADRNAMATGSEMIDLTHQGTSPWTKVYEIENKPLALIPYEYGLSEHDKEVVEEMRDEHLEMLQSLQ